MSTMMVVELYLFSVDVEFKVAQLFQSNFEEIILLFYSKNRFSPVIKLLNYKNFKFFMHLKGTVDATDKYNKLLSGCNVINFSHCQFITASDCL